MEVSSDAEKSNDSFKDLPAVNIQSSLSSASSANSESLPKDVTTKRKHADDKSDDLGTKIKEKRTTRNTQKEKLAEEKAEKKRAQELNKIYKPGECMKYMKIEINPNFLKEWYTSDIEREVEQIGAKIVPTLDLCHCNLVLWRRCVPQKLVANEGQVALSASDEPCGRGLFIMTIEDVFPKVIGRTLASYVNAISEVAAAKLTLVVFGSQRYFKSNSRKTKESKHVVITEVDLEMAITDLLISTGTDTVLINQANELALLIAQSTKAIAEAPFKKTRHDFDDQVDFYMRGDNKKCVSVDKDGNGLSNLWQQMISVLPLCSLETSRALCSNYKTPLALYETLLKTDGAQTIANLGVTRSAVPGSRARRIGPEFARKLHTLFTSEDENALVE